METTNLEKKQIDLIRESIRVYQKCTECRVQFVGGSLRFSDIDAFVDDKGRSHLFHLKEMSHELFRNSECATYKEKLYDITMGYMFHEAMKLRENMYQLEYYRPQCDIPLHKMTDHEKRIVHEIGMLVTRAETRLREAFKEIKVLMNQLVEQLRDLMILYKENYLLPRFVFENEAALRKIYGKRGFENLLNELYSDGRYLLVLKAAQSYLQSQYYETARLLFKKAVHMNNDDLTADFLYMYASAYYFYFKNMFTHALMLAEKAKHLTIDEKVRLMYADSLNRLIADVSREIKKKHAH
ncbi:MAG TPA: hypothetical protein VHO84_05985 [Syntrophorhabdaceae bacterium]|nr:hypothetical protein [Syntrophorhabdaceae bacterium]